MKRARKNSLPIAAFNLRETGPQALADLTKSLGSFRIAHGKGADRRATVDAAACPHCNHAVEWALTYKRGPEAPDGTPTFVPYVYARCRNAPKSHRWDFTHFVPEAKASPPVHVGATALPAPRPSVGTGAKVMAQWIEARAALLQKELEDLMAIKRVAERLAPPPPPMPQSWASKAKPRA